MSIGAKTRTSPKKPQKTQLTGVKPTHPCPVCGKDHKCSRGEDGLILCGRKAGIVPGFHYFGQAKGDPQFGLYRSEVDGPGDHEVPAKHVVDPKPEIDWGKKTRVFERKLTAERAEQLAANLGVPTRALTELGVGWSDNKACWTLPEKNDDATVVGVSFRYPSGKKRMMPGSSRGLYFSADWEDVDGPILCAEGFSDTAALSSMGLCSIGRPSNTGGVDHVAGLLANVPKERAIIVLGENDQKADGEWPGKDGAVATAVSLTVLLSRPVLFALPPNCAKDVRAWLGQQHADSDDDGVLKRLGTEYLRLIQGNARVAILWEPLLPFDEFGCQPFPTEALPTWLRGFVEATAMATQTPTDLAAMLSLSAVSAAVAKKVAVEVREGYREPVNLFTVTAQPPASRKSAVFHAVAAPIEEYDREKAEEAKPLVAEGRAKQAIAQKTLDEFERKASKATDENQPTLIGAAIDQAKQLVGLEIPQVPRLLADDATPERLTGLMAANSGRIAVLSPEGEVFDMMGGKYTANKQATCLSTYLKAHAGDTIRVDRMNRPPEFISEPALTLGLAVQPHVIERLAQHNGFRGMGLLARFLYAMPESQVGSRLIDPPPTPAAIRHCYRQCMRHLLELPFAVEGSDEPGAHVVHLSPGAYDRWRDFAEWLEPQLSEFGELAGISDWAGKLAGAAARIAGLLHAADLCGGGAMPWEVPIPAATMERAVSIAKYLIPHARKAFAAMGGDPAVASARYVLAWLRKNGQDSVSKKQCFDGTRGRFDQVEALEPSLRLLAKHNYIQERQTPHRPGPGRRRSPVYDVNPSAFSRSQEANAGPARTPLPSSTVQPEGGEIPDPDTSPDIEEGFV